MGGDKKREMLITTKLIDREVDKQTVKQAEIIRDREKKRERDGNYYTTYRQKKNINKQKDKQRVTSLQKNCRIEEKKWIMKTHNRQV